MAVALKGEADVAVSSGTFTLAYTFRAAASLEASFGKPFPKIIEDMQASQSITDLTAVLAAGLKKHHPDLSLDQVGDLITMAEAGIWAEALGKAIGGEGAGEAARPSKAKAATGG